MAARRAPAEREANGSPAHVTTPAARDHPHDVGPAAAGVRFEHSALLYADEDEYLQGTLPFIEEGLAAGEPVLVAVPAPGLELLRGAVGPDDLVQFTSMEALGGNPAWIIPAWDDFVGRYLRSGRSARGIGEPAWPGRFPDELVECGRHESLLNLAFAGAGGFKLLCPYDASALERSVIDEAHRNHPQIGGPGALAGSEEYRADVPTMLDAPLAPAPDTARVLRFDADHLAAMRCSAAEVAAAAHLSDDKIDDLMVVVSEGASNSIRYGGGSGEITLWHDGRRFFCDIRDRGRIEDPLAGRRRPGIYQRSGRGLWLMHQLCDLVQIRALPDGQVVRIQVAI